MITEFTHIYRRKERHRSAFDYDSQHTAHDHEVVLRGERGLHLDHRLYQTLVTMSISSTLE